MLNLNQSSMIKDERLDNNYDKAKLAHEMRSRLPLDVCVIESNTSRGHGGQNVNKLQTRAILKCELQKFFTLEEIARIEKKYPRRIKDGFFKVESQKYRAFERNKQEAHDNLCMLLTEALLVQKPRIATKISYSAKVRRKTENEIRKKVKKLRRDIGRF